MPSQLLKSFNSHPQAQLGPVLQLVLPDWSGTGKPEGTQPLGCQFCRAHQHVPALMHVGGRRDQGQDQGHYQRTLPAGWDAPFHLGSQNPLEAPCWVRWVISEIEPDTVSFQHTADPGPGLVSFSRN